MSKYKFKEGDEVFHKDNLTEKLIVRRILKESKEILKWNGKEQVKESVIKMIGIECHWWSFNKETEKKELIKDKFHSNELIPKEIVEKGKEEIVKFINNNN